MTKYEDFRAEYPEFIYKSYELSENNEEIFIKYNFEISGLSSFAPEWKIRKKILKVLLMTENSENLCFHLEWLNLLVTGKSHVLQT